MWLLAALFLLPGQPLPKALPPGTEVVLKAGVHASIELEGQDLILRAEPGAVIDAGGHGHGVVASGKNLLLVNLRVQNTGPKADFYEPDSAVYLANCAHCRVENLRAEGVVTAVRAEETPGLIIQGVRAKGNRRGPGITVYDAKDVTIEDNHLENFLDNLYVERIAGGRIQGNTLLHSYRYGLHVMFSRDVEVVHNTAAHGRVGSAVMYGRRVSVHDNRFFGHVGPLAFGLLSQEQHDSAFFGNEIFGNNVGILVVSAQNDRFFENTLKQNGFAVLVLREKNKGSTAAVFEKNHFLANVYDVAVDDPEARVALKDNAYDRAPRLDLDKDGVSDVPYLPSSSYALLASRMLDLSLFAFSPGVKLWEEAEKKVPGLRLLSLVDPRPRILVEAAPGRFSGGLLLLALLALVGGLWLRS